MNCQNHMNEKIQYGKYLCVNPSIKIRIWDFYFNLIAIKCVLRISDILYSIAQTNSFVLVVQVEWQRSMIK